MLSRRQKKNYVLLRGLSYCWRSIPVHCSLCGKPNSAPEPDTRESVGWCRHCHRVFRLPLLKAPSWVTGVLAVLMINLMG